MYRGRLQRDFSLWVEKGLLPGETAEILLKELDSRPHSFTVGRVLMMLAAVLVSAAILLFVAANWDGIPVVVRSGMLIALIWVFYGLAAFTAGRGNNFLPGALLVLGTATFGAAISLIGQMYNLSGDGLSAAMVWFLLTVIAAVLFRSAALTYFSGVLAWFTFAMLLEAFDAQANGLWFYAPLLQAVAVVALVYYTGAARARHFSYLLVLTWLGWCYVNRNAGVLPWHFAAAGTILFLLTTLPQSPFIAAARRAGAAPAFYSFLLAVMGFGLYQIDHSDLFTSTSGALETAVPAMLVAAFAVMAIALAGRDNGAVRYSGYAIFAVEILYLSMEVAGTMIGTSGLFLLSGFFLAGIAWLVIRLEKRFAAAQAKAGA